LKLNPAVELPQRGTRSTKQKEAVTGLIHEAFTRWVKGCFAEESGFHSIPLRLLWLIQMLFLGWSFSGDWRLVLGASTYFCQRLLTFD
jgi:hypothetical protein